MSTGTGHPYRYFLNGWNPDSDELTRRALLDVQDSGLSPEILERAQARIFDGKADTLKDRLGFAKIDGQSILQSYRLIEFPYIDEKGNVTRYEYKPFPSAHFKNEEKPRKYLQAKGQAPTPYILPDVWAAKDKNNRPLWITEGVKKVLAIAQAARLAVGLSGVWNFRAGKDREDPENIGLWADLEGFRWTGRTVYIGFDADLWVNPMVRHALYELSFILYAQGAVLRFPMWQEAKGIDDFLCFQDDPEKALIEIEKGAKDLEGLLCHDHRGEILRALQRTAQGRSKVTERALVAMIAKKLGVKPKDLQSDLSSARHAELKAKVDNSLYPFFIADTGGVCRWRRERDGIETALELSNFSARITEDVTLDTGLETTRRFMIEGSTQEVAFPAIAVRTSEFGNLNWVVNHWGNDAIIRAGQTNRDCLREFIQVYSQHRGVTRRTVYGHTGWREIGGTWAYLHGNGAIGAEGVEVELPPDLTEAGRYSLPSHVEREKEAEAIRAIFDYFLMLGKFEITFPALAYVFLSPLTTLLDPMPSFCLYAHGEKDTFKTALAVLMLAFFGAHTKAGLSNFDSTSNAIMQRAALLKDCLFVCDDYYPSPRQKEAQQKESIAQRIIRDVGNRTGRGRLNPDSSVKPLPIPRGMILITGEELPALQSTLSRVVTIELSHGDIDPQRLTAAQEKAALFPYCMTSYLLWLKDHITAIRENFSATFQELRSRAGVENKSRKIPEHVAYVQFAWRTFLSWAGERATVDPALEPLGFDIFQRVTERHAKRVEAEDPMKSFFEIIGGLLTQGKLRLDHIDAGYEGGRIGGDAGELVGYHDSQFYYFLPGPLWHAVQTYLRLEGGHFPFSKSTLYDVLQRRGILETRGGKRIFTHRVGGRSQGVLKLRRGDEDVFSRIAADQGANEPEPEAEAV